MATNHTKLPSNSQIGERIALNTTFDIEAPQYIFGTVVAVTFTESKVLYDIAIDASEYPVRCIDSAFVSPARVVRVRPKAVA